MMRQPLLSRDGCNALSPSRWRHRHMLIHPAPRSCVQVRSLLVCKHAAFHPSLSKVSNDLLFFLRVYNSRLRSQYGCALTPLRGPARGLLPDFWPQWLPGLPLPPIFQTTGCTATQRLSAFPTRRSHSFSGWLRRSVYPRSLGDLGELRTLGH